MKPADILPALRRLKVETGSLACFGCEYEDKHCSTQGCAVIRAAAEELEKMQWRPVSENPPPPYTTLLLSIRDSDDGYLYTSAGRSEERRVGKEC